MVHLKRYFVSIAAALALATVGQAKDRIFETKLCANDSKEIAVDLTVGATALVIRRQTKDAQPTEIPYSTVTRLGYGFTNHRRIAEALVGGLAALAVTSPLRHWLVVESNAGNERQVTLFRLRKTEYSDIIAELNAKSGKHVEFIARESTELDPTKGSRDTDEVVPFPMDRVVAGLKPAMETVACKVKRQALNQVSCSRPHINTDRTGFGGEYITAELEAAGDGTRVRIHTAKLGLNMGKNWSSPIYRALRKQLGLPES
jgi:hypothetical protein